MNGFSIMATTKMMPHAMYGSDAMINVPTTNPPAIVNMPTRCARVRR